MKPKGNRQALRIGERLSSENGPIRPRRTVRQQEDGPNREKTALLTNEESASLRPHERISGRPGRKFLSAAARLSPDLRGSKVTQLSPRPPDGRHSTAMAI